MVDIVDPLAPEFDLASIELTSVGWGDTLIPIPAGRSFFQTTVGMTYKGIDFVVDVTIGVRPGTRELYAQFLTLDPATELPPNAQIGFLPPEDGTKRGMGFFTYTIRLRPEVPDGTMISNIATITFDRGQTIATDQVDPLDPSKGTDPAKRAFITLDGATPRSTVTALGATTGTESFPVAWTAEDGSGSGAGLFTIYVAVDGGGWTPWLTGTPLREQTFTGVPGKTYAFYAVATDNVGNVEVKAPVVEAVTFVSANAAPVLAAIAPIVVREGDRLDFVVAATDADAGQKLTFTLEGDVPAGMAIDSATGRITWRPASGPAVSSPIVRVTDDGVPNRSATRSFQVTVRNVIPRVEIVGKRDATSGEAWVAAANWADPGAQSWTAEIDYGDGSPLVNLVLDPANRSIPLARTFTTVGEKRVVVTVVDSAGGTFAASYPVIVGPVAPVNAAPTAVRLTNVLATVAEDRPMTTRLKVADIAIDDDANGTNTITLAGPDAGLFEVEPAAARLTAQLFLKAGTVLDYETKRSYAVTVRVSDQSLAGSASQEAGYSLTVTNVNETPVTASVADGVLSVLFAATWPDQAEHSAVITREGDTYRVVADGTEAIGSFNSSGLTGVVVEGSSRVDRFSIAGAPGTTWPLGLMVDAAVDVTTVSLPIQTPAGVSIGGATILAANVTTVGGQTFQGATTLASSVNLDAGGEAIRIGGPLDGVAARQQELVVTTTGPVTLDGAIGTIQSLAALKVVGGAMTRINGSAVQAGTIALGDVRFGGDSTLAAETGDLTTGAIDGIAGSGVNVALSAAEALGVTGAVGKNVPLGSLAIHRSKTAAIVGAVTIDGRLPGAGGDGLVIGAAAQGIDLRAPGSLVFGSKGAGVAFKGGSAGSTIAGLQISGVGGDGIRFGAGDYGSTSVRGNRIIGNGGAGIATNGAVRGLSLGASGDGNVIEGNRAGIEIRNGAQDIVVSGNRVSGNYGTGISIFGAQTARVRVQDCLVGTDASGSGPMGNAGHGILVAAAADVVVTGSKVGANSLNGVVILAGASGTLIDSSSIGFGGGASPRLGNGQSGVWVLGPSSGTVITATTIAANGNSGIQMTDGAKTTTVGGLGALGNTIRDNASFGVTVSGDVAGSQIVNNAVTANGQYGFYVNSATGVLVGGSSADVGNRVSDSVQGIVIGGSLQGTAIRNNTIEGNPSGGIVMLNAQGLTIGVGNRIVRNSSYGIFATGPSADSVIRGNELSGQAVGIWLHAATGLSIGSADGLRDAPDTDANTIGDNSAIGVYGGEASSGTSILSNVIVENGIYGILASSPSGVPVPVDAALAKTTKPNDTVTFRMPKTTSEGTYRIQVFRTSAGRKGGGQGEVLLATRDVVVGAASTTFSLQGLSGIVAGDRVTLTATRIDGGRATETSGFSIEVTAV